MSTPDPERHATCRRCGASIDWREVRGSWLAVGLAEIPVVPGSVDEADPARAEIVSGGRVVVGRKVDVGTDGAVVGPRLHTVLCKRRMG